MVNTEQKNVLFYHSALCNKQINTLSYYYHLTSDKNIKESYKVVLHSIVDQHTHFLKKYEFENHIQYDSIDWRWITDLHQKINKLHD